MFFDKFYPTQYYRSAYIIDYEKLYEQGYRGIIYDLDNTLVTHGAPADDRALTLMERLKNIGYNITFLSNNGEERVKMFNEKIGVNYIYKAGKPKPSGYLKAVEMMDCKPENTLFVGDQLFTDIWGANLANIRSCLVVPIDKSTDEIQIVFKRKLENVILKRYLKEHEIIDKQMD